MNDDILTADDLQLGDEMFVEYGKKNNLSNEQKAFIDLWSAKDRIDEKQTKLLKTLIKVYRQEKRLKNAKLKSNNQYQRSKKQQIKNDKDRAYQLMQIIGKQKGGYKAIILGMIILYTIDTETGFSDAVDVLFKSEHEKHDFIGSVEKYYKDGINKNHILNAVENSFITSE